MLCQSSACLSHALSQALAALSVEKVHLNPIPIGAGKGRVFAVGTDGQCGITRAKLALGCWVHGKLVGRDT